MSGAKYIYSIADNPAQTVQVCIDRLHELGASAQFKLLTGRLQKLAVRAASGDDDKGIKAAQRQRGRPQNLKGQRNGATVAENRADDYRCHAEQCLEMATRTKL
jgi:hypothetical protein